LNRNPNRMDLLITDVIMPHMSGKELAEQIQSLKPGIQILFMSGYTADVMVHRGILEKGVHFLPKPFSINLLAAKVREVLDENGSNPSRIRFQA